MLLVLEPFALPGQAASRPNFATAPMWWAAALIVLTCLAAALLTRRLQAAATLPATFAVGGVVLLAGAVGTGSLGSLLLVLALFALAWLLGETLLLRLPSTAAAPLSAPAYRHRAGARAVRSAPLIAGDPAVRSIPPPWWAAPASSCW